MSAIENWTAAQAAAAAEAVAPAPAAGAAGTVWPRTQGLQGHAGQLEAQHGAHWHEASHALGVGKNPLGGESTNREFAAGVACISSTSEDSRSKSVSAPEKDVQQVASTGTVGGVECQKSSIYRCAHVDATKTEHAPAGVGLFECVASEIAQLSGQGEQPVGLESIPEAVHSTSIVRCAVNCQGEEARPELCADAVATPVTCEGVFADVAFRAEGSAVAAGGVAVATLGFSEAVFPKAALSTEGTAVPGTRFKNGDAVTVDQGNMEPVLTSTLASEELESCKQQLQEMKARLDALWSQKEAFRQANERLSRAVGRLQGQEVASRQNSFHPFNLSPPEAASVTERGSPPTRSKPMPRRFSHQRFVLKVAGGGGAALDTKLSTRSARRYAALSDAPFSSSPCGQSVHGWPQGQRSGSPPGEPCSRHREAKRESKAGQKERDTSDLKDLQPPSLKSGFLCLQATRMNRRDNNCFSGEDPRLNSSSGSSRVSIGACTGLGIPPSPSSQEDEVKRQLPTERVHQRGFFTTHFPANSRRSLPPVPRLDLQDLLHPQQRAAVGPASSARGSACAVSRKMVSAASDVHSSSRRDRRLRSSKRRSSSRSFAADVSKFSFECEHQGVLDEAESLDARRESVTTQDSIRSKTSRGGKGGNCRHTNLPRCPYKDGIRSEQSSVRESSEKKEIVARRRRSIVACGFPAVGRPRECAIGRRQSHTQSNALAGTENLLKYSLGSQAYRQRSLRREGQRFDTYSPLQSRPVCAVGGSWRPVLSLRSTVGGGGQREPAPFSARPSLAETAMKTPRTCFLDDRIVRAPHWVRSSISRNDDASPSDCAGEERTTSGKTAPGGEGTSENHAGSGLANDRGTPPLPLEEQLAIHVRHCMGLLHCTEASREDDLRTANVSRPVLSIAARSAAGRTAKPFVDGPPREEGEARGRGGKRATTDGSPLCIQSSTPVLSGGYTAMEAEEDSTLQACVRKPRDGVFKVCIRHLLRSTRDFFDSARVLWWQPLPVVCSDEWLPYDEVMRCRADAQIRALREKHPALAAAARERESRKAAAAQASSEEGRAITRNTMAQGGKHKDMDSTDTGGRHRVVGSLSSRSFSRTDCTAGHEAKRGWQSVCPREGGTVAETTSVCSGSFPKRHSKRATEENGVQATPCSFVKTDEHVTVAAGDAPGNRGCEGCLSPTTGDRVSECEGAGGCRLRSDKQRGAASADQKTNASPKARRAPPRYDSEWDAVGLVYVGSLCAEQPVAEFRRMLVSCSSNTGEAGGWYVSNSKAKPSCLLISPSSDISFLLSEPLRRSSTESSFSGATSICSSISAASYSSSESEEPQKDETRSFSESHRSSCLREAGSSHNPREDKGFSRQARDDRASTLCGTPKRSDLLGLSTSSVRSPYCGELRTRNSTSSATRSSDSYSIRSNTSSSSSATGSSNSTSSSVIISHGSAACRRLQYSAMLAGKKPNRALAQPETPETAFDKTCQLSLSRKLGPQELFIVKRCDREHGCFPLYHHFSGRYLCVHSTSGLIGMVCANATPAAATAARALQKEIKASCRLTRDGGTQTRSGAFSQLSAFGGCTGRQRRQHRKSEDYGGEVIGEKSSMMEDQLACDSSLMETTEKGPTAEAGVHINKQRMSVEKGAAKRRQIAAALRLNTHAMCDTQEHSSPGIIPLTASASDSRTPAALSPPSPLLLSRVPHAAETSVQVEADATLCSVYSEDACARTQPMLSGESARGSEEGSSRAEHIRKCGRGSPAAETLREDGERSGSVSLTDELCDENRRRVTVSAAQHGARKLGTLIYGKRFKSRPKPPTEHSDTFASSSRGEPSIKPARGADAEELPDCSACGGNTGVTVPGGGPDVYISNQLRNLSLTPSLFELVTVSDLLVQQTVAQILASVPQPTFVAEKSKEISRVSDECAHAGHAGQVFDRVVGEAEASTQVSRAESSKKREEQSLTLEGHKALEEQEKAAPGIQVNSTDMNETQFFCKRDCNYDSLVDAGTEESSCRRGGSECAATSTVIQHAATLSRRSCRYSDLHHQAAVTASNAPSCCSFTPSTSSRNSISVRRSNNLSRNFPLMLPISAAKRGPAQTQRPLLMQDSFMRTERRVSTRETEAHRLARLQHQLPVGKHRQHVRRPHQTANRKEQASSTLLAKNLEKCRPFGVTSGCEQFILDDCDALTEIATDEIRAGRHDG